MNIYDIDNPELITLYDEVPLWSAYSGLDLLNHIQFGRRLRILDVGFGTGFPLVEMAERACRTCKVYGLDPWEAAAERAREKCKVFGVDNVDITTGHAEKMPYKDKFFDLIISNNGLNNTQDTLQALKECHRVAKPGSIMLFTANMPESMHEFYDVFRAVLTEKKKAKELKALEAHIHERRLSLMEWEDLLNAAGFRLSGLWENQFQYFFANGTTLLDHHFIRMAFLPSWLAILKKADRQPIFEELESRLNSIAFAGNGIRLTVPYACFEARKK